MTPKVAAQMCVIRRGLSQGLTQKQIGADLGISRQHVSSLKRRHIDGMNMPLYRRWIDIHDIRGIGERAVRETA